MKKKRGDDSTPGRDGTKTHETDGHGGSGRRPGDADAGDDRSWREVVQRQHDPERGELSADLVFAIAEAVGVAPGDLMDPPLFEVVDVGALDAMFFDGDDESEDATGMVEFSYDGFLVRVERNGWIRVFEHVDGETG